MQAIEGRAYMGLTVSEGVHHNHGLEHSSRQSGIVSEQQLGAHIFIHKEEAGS